MSRATIVRACVGANALLIAMALASGWVYDDIGLEFEEDGIATTASAIQLCIVAAILSAVARERTVRASSAWLGRAVAMPWAALAGVFLLMAADERFELHESFDIWLHRALDMADGPLSDRIDDLLLALYAVPVAAVLYRYRSELATHAPSYGLLAAAAMASAGMFVLDVATNRDDLLGLLITDSDLRVDTWVALSIVEDSLKLIAGGLFVAGAWIALTSARRAHR